MVRLKGFQELISVENALNKLLVRLKPERLDGIFIPLNEALARITANDINSERDLPPFNRSAVDGYALIASDIVDASQFEPKTLCLVEKETIKIGEAKEIWTGNPLPQNADSVVMLEHTKKTGGKISVLLSLTPGTNVSKKGEDVKKGETVVIAGTRLGPHHLGLLAALGINEVRVVKKPTVAILATGNELTPLGSEIKSNQIIEVNSIILSGKCNELGVDIYHLGIAKDEEEEIKHKILEGLERADIVITTGGTSVGAPDLLPRVIEKIAPDSMIVHGIAMRPGMPTALAVIKEKPIIILSGNPVASIVGFEVFVRPIIKKLLGIKQNGSLRIKAKLTRRVTGVLGRRVFLRVKVTIRGEEYFAEPVRVKGSGIITTMTRANGYVVIPEDREGLKRNEVVSVLPFN